MLCMGVAEGLSAAEWRVWDAFPAGLLVEFEIGNAEGDDPARAEGWDPDRQVRAEVLAALLCGAVEPEPGQMGQVNLVGARIIGRLELPGATFKYGLRLNQCYVMDGINLSGATIQTLDLQNCHVGKINMLRAEINGPFSLRGTTFGDNASFASAAFSGKATFDNTTFGTFAYFSDATFSGDPSFHGATFGYDALLSRVTFRKGADFSGATFGDGASFRGATFGANTNFNGATFGDSTTFNDVIFDSASFNNATFGDGALLGFTASDEIVLPRSQMGRGGSIRITCPELNLSFATFPEGVTILVREADVTIDSARFGGPSIIAALRPFQRADERISLDFIGPRLPSAPRVLSLAGCDVTHLTVNGVDLRPCRFADTYNLERLRIGGAAVFAKQPRARRWTRRLVLAEEHAWRAIYEPGRRRLCWYPPECRSRGEPEPEHQPKQRRSRVARMAAETVELTYRALRKGLEDIKDEPGAADFYYGEMEMRRRAASPHSVERFLLFVYWLVAGYGLRASRALATLLLVVAFATVGFVTVGFAPSATTAYQQVTVPGDGTRYEPREILGAPSGWAEAVTYSAQSTTSLLRAPTTEPLTESGQVIEIVLRLLGPLLLGLAILAVRGRVKR